jgi:lactoylglutathione lyase
MSKILYAMVRVGDMQRSIDFYTKVMGMELLDFVDNHRDKFSLAFVGYGKVENAAAIELTYNYGVTNYERGNGFGHIAISVNDCAKKCKEIKERGGKVTLEPKRLDWIDETIAFVEDPDGYRIELVEAMGK